MKLTQWAGSSTAQARRIVRSIVASHTRPLSVQEIYKLAVQAESSKGDGSQSEQHASTSAEQKGTTLPPHPNHAIRSMSYLKHVVLPDLAHLNELEKVHGVHTLTPEELEQRLQSLTKNARQAAHLSTQVDIWRWQQKAARPEAVPKPAPRVFGVEVGVEEDWSHLNKRRQRSREASVKRDVRWVRQLENARTEAAAEVAQPSASA